MGDAAKIGMRAAGDEARGHDGPFHCAAQAVQCAARIRGKGSRAPWPP